MIISHTYIFNFWQRTHTCIFRISLLKFEQSGYVVETLYLVASRREIAWSICFPLPSSLNPDWHESDKAYEEATHAEDSLLHEVLQRHLNVAKNK